MFNNINQPIIANNEESIVFAYSNLLIILIANFLKPNFLIPNNNNYSVTFWSWIC